MPERDDIAIRFTRLADNEVVALLNQIPERCRDDATLHRICDVAELLMASEVQDLLPLSSQASFDRWVLNVMTQRQALALVTLAVEAEVIRPDEGDSVEDLARYLLKKVRGVYSTAAQAAARAVVELDGPVRVGIPFWMLYALEDDGYDPCEHLLRTVELATRNTAPGRRWFEGVSDLGYVLFEHS